MIEAQRFAQLDIFRAATHNKGIMNGYYNFFKNNFNL